MPSMNPTFVSLTTSTSGERKTDSVKLDRNIDLPPNSQVGANYNSTVRIGYKNTPRATGICISTDGLIVTARHLIIGMRGKENDAFDINQFYAEFPRPKNATPALPLQLVSELPRFQNPNDDIVIFQAPANQDPYPSSPFTTSLPQKHSNAYTISYPYGVSELTLGEVLDPSFQEAYNVAEETYGREKSNTNIFSRFIKEMVLTIGKANIGGIVSTNSINAGSSRGPLFNGNGEVCGITTSTIDNFIINMRKHFVKTFGIQPKHLPLNQIAVSQPIKRVTSLLEKLGANVQKILDGEPSGLNKKLKKWET